MSSISIALQLIKTAYKSTSFKQKRTVYNGNHSTFSIEYFMPRIAYVVLTHRFYKKLSVDQALNTCCSYSRNLEISREFVVWVFDTVDWMLPL
jgi:hypothetical protein